MESCVVIVRASARAQCGSGPIQTTFHIHTCHKFCSHFNSREVSVLGELPNIKLFLPASRSEDKEEEPGLDPDTAQKEDHGTKACLKTSFVPIK